MQIKAFWCLKTLFAFLAVILEWVIAAEIDDLDKNFKEDIYGPSVFARVWVSFTLIFYTAGTGYILFSGDKSSASPMAFGALIGSSLCVILFMMAEAGNIGVYNSEFIDVKNAELALAFVSIHLILVFFFTALLFVHKEQITSGTAPGEAPNPAAPAQSNEHPEMSDV